MEILPSRIDAAAARELVREYQAEKGSILSWLAVRAEEARLTRRSEEGLENLVKAGELVFNLLENGDKCLAEQEREIAAKKKELEDLNIRVMPLKVEVNSLEKLKKELIAERDRTKAEIYTMYERVLAGDAPPDGTAAS